MLRTDTIEQAKGVWLEYGEAVKEAFGFEGFLDVKPLQAMLQSFDEDSANEWIAHVQNMTALVRSARSGR